MDIHEVNWSDVIIAMKLDYDMYLYKKNGKNYTDTERSIIVGECMDSIIEEDCIWDGFFKNKEKVVPIKTRFTPNTREIVEEIEFCGYNKYNLKIFFRANPLLDLFYMNTYTSDIHCTSKVVDYLRTPQERIKIIKKRVLIKLVFMSMYTRICHTRYQPGGIDYLNVKEDFEELKNKSFI
jgi:hypothetical protein